MKCPYCGEEISYLTYLARGVDIYYEFHPDGTTSNCPTMAYENHWICPFCGETIATTYEEAIEFLNKEE